MLANPSYRPLFAAQTISRWGDTLNTEVPAHQRGRVFADYDMIWQTGRLASLGLGGLAADTLGIQAVYLLGSVLLLLAGATGLARLPPIKHSNPQS